MVHYLIVCRSLTYAQRTARVLEHVGITAVITRTPHEISDNGCSYCVKISERNIVSALKNLNASKLGHGKIYLVRNDGIGQEVEGL